jgi:hypothetical protein
VLTDPRPVAVARIGLGFATILNAWEMHQLLGRIADGRVSLPVLAWMPAPTTLAVNVYLMVAAVAGLMLLLGSHAAVAAIITTMLNVVVFLWDEQTYSSHRLLATLLVAYLVFVRSDAAWAVRPVAGSVRRAPQALMMTQLSVCYFFAALSKMNLLFLSGAPLSLWVWVPLPSWGFTAMAFGTVATEIFLALGLWTRRYRAGAMVVGVLLHLGIVTLMAEQTVPLISFAITCLCLYPLFWVGLGTHLPKSRNGERATAGVATELAQRQTETP